MSEWVSEWVNKWYLLLLPVVYPRIITFSQILPLSLSWLLYRVFVIWNELQVMAYCHHYHLITFFLSSVAVHVGRRNNSTIKYMKIIREERNYQQSWFSLDIPHNCLVFTSDYKREEWKEKSRKATLLVILFMYNNEQSITDHYQFCFSIITHPFL